MKIDKSLYIPEVAIKEIPEDGCFLWNNTLYMRIHGSQFLNDTKSKNWVVNLSDGNIGYFNNDVKVEPVDCHITKITEGDKNES